MAFALLPAAQHKLGSPWIRPNKVVQQATGHMVGIQKGLEKPIVFVHVDDLKLCPAPRDLSWNPGILTSKSLCASTVAYRPGSHISDITSTPSVGVSDWDVMNTHHSGPNVQKELDSPIDITGHILSPFYIRDFNHQDWQRQWRSVLMDIYGHLCLTDMASKTAQSSPRPFTLHGSMPWGDMPSGDTGSRANVVSDILVDAHVRATAGRFRNRTFLCFLPRRVSIVSSGRRPLQDRTAPLPRSTFDLSTDLPGWFSLGLPHATSDPPSLPISPIPSDSPEVSVVGVSPVSQMVSDPPSGTTGVLLVLLGSPPFDRLRPTPTSSAVASSGVRTVQPVGISAGLRALFHVGDWPGRPFSHE